MSDAALLESTLPPPPRTSGVAESHFALTILCHGDWQRVGSVAMLPRFSAGEPVELSRLVPLFVDPITTRPTAPLADPHLSRSPVRLELVQGAVSFTPRAEVELFVNGEPITRTASVPLPPEGLVVRLGRQVLLLLHRHHGRWSPERHGFVGQSTALQTLLFELERVAPAVGPVLIRGETGTGKELIARALHQLSPRARGPFVAVNLAAVSSGVATSELFGHAAGAFTGAARAHGGYFGEADGGTLFLDEVGELALDTQAMLLRVLESGEVQPVGGRPHRVDVRVVAATDSDLESGIVEGEFRRALYHRLAAFQLVAPALRERLDDLGRLVGHFSSAPNPLMTAAAMERLALAPWPGNLRELRNVVGQLSLARASASAPIEEHPSLPRVPTSEAAARSPSPALDETRLLDALRSNQWRIAATARTLGISRTTLYARIDSSTTLRKASDIPEAELRSVWAECGGDAELAARRLEVSARALSVRARTLGL